MPHKDKEAARAYKRNWYKKTRERWSEVVLRVKSEGCVDCGNKDHRVLEFHHRDPSEKSYVIGRMVNCSIDNLMSEIEKCDVLCANCHAIRHYEQKHAPLA